MVTWARIFLFIVWLMISLSVFNALMLIWLSLTVYLNAERRNRGIYLISFSSIVGAIFFISHTIILAYELTYFGTQQLNLVWTVGWMPVIFAPFLGYSIVLWYAGYWDDVADNRLRRRHQYIYALIRLLTLIIMILVIFFEALPAYTRLAKLDLTHTLLSGGVPLLFLIYPVLAFMAWIMAIDALLRPELSQRLMGNLARQRARPWLMGSATLLLIVSLLAMVFLLWVVYLATPGLTSYDYDGTPETGRLFDSTYYIIWSVVLSDVILSGMISLAIIFVGKAVVSYEVFTGKTLPRRGFARYWRNTVILAFLLSATISWHFLRQEFYIYSVLMISILVMFFFAVLGWQSFAYREALIAQLRPFVSSENFLQGLLSNSTDVRTRSAEIFHTICAEILETPRAQLVPLGMVAPLTQSLTYPADKEIITLNLSPQTLAQASSTMFHLPDTAPFNWTIPLWSERGIIGALLITNKQNGGLYTEEEIQVAQSSAERIIDMLASEEMIRRLMRLQRQRQQTTRALDMQTRRVLHDDILPTLHTAVLQLSTLEANPTETREIIDTMTDVHGQISNLIHQPHPKPNFTPNGNWLESLKTDLSQELGHHFTKLTWDLPNQVPEIDDLSQTIIFGAIRELLRNAALHGRGMDVNRALHATICVKIANNLQITVDDDGVGLNQPTPQPKTQGSGGGLALHSTLLAVVGGYLTLESLPDNSGARGILTLPIESNPS